MTHFPLTRAVRTFTFTPFARPHGTAAMTRFLGPGFTMPGVAARCPEGVGGWSGRVA
jgi:hypothetical protein